MGTTFSKSDKKTIDHSNDEKTAASQPNEKPPCAVIVTFYDRSSYDCIFRAVEQESPNPDFSVKVFSFRFNEINSIMRGLQNEIFINSTIKSLSENIANVTADSVVFNFECCSGCNDEMGFGIYSKDVMALLELAVSRAYVAMFGDFSLKALIAVWEETYERSLGPNPFVNEGTCSGFIDLRFDPNKLQQCSIAQLRNVGLLSDAGYVQLHALPSTIVYSIDKQKSDTSAYTIDVLTTADVDYVVPHQENPAGMFCSLSTSNKKSSRRGKLKPENLKSKEYVGHVQIEYPSGGTIVTSAGHWIELCRVTGTDEALINTYERQYGNDSEQYRTMSSEMTSCRSEVERDEVKQKFAKRIVQSSAPCKKFTYT